MNAHRPLLQSTEQGSGPTVHYRDHYLYSTKNPQAGPVRVAGTTTLLPATLILVPSLGLGYGIPELLGRLPTDCHVLCVEHDEALWDFASDVRTRLAGDPRLTLLFAADLRPIHAFLAARRPGEFRRVTTVRLCAAERLFPDFYKKVAQCLAEEVQIHWQNRMTLIHMGRLYVKNIFANLALLERARDLATHRTDRPVIAIGAGPSLTRTLPLLRRLQPHAALLAVDTALPVLVASGLAPDYVVALEPQFINIRDFYSLPSGSAALLADLASAPQVVRFCLDRGCPAYFFASHFAPLALWDRLQRSGLLPLPIPPLGSVGVAAAWLALRMSTGPVFLCGFDFSYTGRRTHAAGSPASLADAATASRLTPAGQREFAALCTRPRVTLRGKTGETVESDLVLSSYARHLAALTGNEPRVFDLGEQGLDLGAPRLTDGDEALTIAASSRGTAPAVHPTAPEGSDGWQTAALHGFLKEENELLEESNRLLASLIGPDRPAQGTLDARQAAVIRKSNHSFLHLAGKTTLPDYTQAYAARALIEGKILAERIRRSL
jgi:hypothetical protein